MIERLERRELLAADLAFLHNPVDPVDVNDDGVVEPMDMLLVVNELNAITGSGAEERANRSPVGRGFFDVNADLQVTPLDALTVLNHLNRGGHRGGPRDGGPPVDPDSAPTDFRAINGADNNLQNPEWGSTDIRCCGSTGRLRRRDRLAGRRRPASASRDQQRRVGAVGDLPMTAT